MSRYFIFSFLLHLFLIVAFIFFEIKPLLEHKKERVISLKHVVLKKPKPKEIKKINKEPKKIKTPPKPKPKPKTKKIKKIVKKIKRKVKRKKIFKKEIKTVKTQIKSEENLTKKMVFKKVIKPLKEISSNKNVKREIKKEYFNVNRSKIYEAIERVKKYPPLAKRLRIQGKVKVKFTLLPSKEIKNIKTSNAHKILQRAAKDTIKKALPYFPKPSRKVDITLFIEYRLK